MKRPLDILFSYAIENRTPMTPRHWTQRVENSLRSLMRLPQPVLAQDTAAPLMVFDNLPTLMDALNLAKLTPYLQENKIDLYPVETPPFDGSSHFAQWALVWEPADHILYRKKTLSLAVGAGHSLLNLTFTPYVGRDCPNDYRVQLDDVKLHRGHEVYAIPAGEPSSPALAHDAFETACCTIRHIHDDYPLAEYTLLNATNRIISGLDAPQSPAKRTPHPQVKP